MRGITTRLHRARRRNFWVKATYVRSRGLNALMEGFSSIPFPVLCIWAGFALYNMRQMIDEVLDANNQCCRGSLNSVIPTPHIEERAYRLCGLQEGIAIMKWLRRRRTSSFLFAFSLILFPLFFLKKKKIDKIETELSQR